MAGTSPAMTTRLDSRVGKAKRAHVGPFRVGTLRFAHPTSGAKHSMRIAEKLVPARQRHLKWRAFDALEMVLMILCGVMLLAFTTTVMLDIVTRTIGHPWLWLQEATSTFFI